MIGGGQGGGCAAWWSAQLGSGLRYNKKITRFIKYHKEL